MSTAVSSRRLATRRYSLLPGVEIDEIKRAIEADGSTIVVQLTQGKVIVVPQPRLEAIRERSICKWVLTSTDASAGIRVVFMKNAQGYYVSKSEGVKPIDVCGSRP